jgi:DNA polymerase-1
MRHIIFEESPTGTYPVALLIKASSFNQFELARNYMEPLNVLGVPSQDVIAFSLSYNEAGKAPVKHIKEYLAKLLPALDGLKVTHLYVADSNYFKALAGQPKADPHFGYVLPCKVKGYEHMNVVLGLNHSALIYNPDLQAKLDMSLQTLASHLQGSYQPLGNNIIHSEHYPSSVAAIAEALQTLHQYDELTADIEAFSLRFDEAGIGTISFAWDQHNGIAFACDYEPIKGPTLPEEVNGHHYGRYVPNPVIRSLIRQFFIDYRGRITWHNISYDAKVQIFHLWMKHPLDTEGLLQGLEVMTRHFHDSKIIAYLAINSTAGNVLGLKSLAHEFAGNWAVEVKDIRTVPLDKLLRYNLIDCLSTAYVRDKYLPIMAADNQLEIYETLMLPSLKLLLQMELTGMPLSRPRVAEARAKLEQIKEGHLNVIMASPEVQTLNKLLQMEAMVAANLKLKVKQHPIEKFADVTFNPGSPLQLQKLFYTQLGLPVIDYTETKQPATGAETIEKLINHAQDPSHKALLAALIGHAKAAKVLSTFIPAFEESLDKGDGVMWLHGSFNLGGTVSGRLSSSDPNLQNIPAGSEYGKLIKSCFVSPEGWLFCGADFYSLEDMISALTTKDPNKLKVYMGHEIFEISVNGVIQTIRDDSIISYDGRTMNARELYEAYCTL